MRHLLVLLAVVALVAAGCALGNPTADGPPRRVSGSGTPDEAGASPDPRPSPTPRLVPVPTRDREATSGPARPDRFDDPATLGEQLVAAEVAIRDPATPDDDLAAWAWTQQQAYRDLVANPDWQEPVRASLPDGLRDAFDANLRATALLRELTEPRDELPAWRIVSPPPADELLGHYRAAEEESGVGWEHLAAIHLVETRMGRIRGASVAGARGPMQFIPATWEQYGEGGDIEDPRDAIRAAARYLVAHGAPTDMERALFAYNRSRNYVEAIRLHAAVMRVDPRTYHGYYHWRVYYRMSGGDVVLPEGFEGTR